MLNSALKWVGGKRRIMDTLCQHLPTAPGRRLVEPFVGSATVFLNTDFDSYLLADINGDLINFHNVAKEHPEELIVLGQLMFANHKGQEGYLAVRASFNLRIEVSNIMRAAKFLYLNRHGYNGMCRYNRRGEFNIPYGLLIPISQRKRFTPSPRKRKTPFSYAVTSPKALKWQRPAMSFTAIRHTCLRRRQPALPITTLKALANCISTT